MRPRSLSVCVASITLLAACGKPAAPAPLGPPPVLLPAEYAWLKPSSALAMIQTTPRIGILDVRELTERAEGVIGNSQSLPFFDEPQKKLSGMDRNRPWLLYCAVGGRSELVAQMMANLGFKEVSLIRGGFDEWKAAGLPVVK